MPLKKSTKKLTANLNPVEEGSIIQTPDETPMSLFESALMPAITLHANQFNWPKTLLVTDVRRVALNEKNLKTGWDLKDANGNKKPTGEFVTRLTVANGDTAQMLVDMGQPVDGLSELQCTIMKDIPVQTFTAGETLIELVKPNVMLGFGGNNVDRIVLVAEDYKEV